LFHVLPPGTGFEAALVGVFVFMVRCFGPANYGVLTTAVTGVVVLLLALNGIAPNAVMLPRGLNTAIGGAIALFAYWIWPTWERTQVGEVMARQLDGYRSYFQELRKAYEQAGAIPSRALDQARVAGRRARSNLEASVDRLSAEPGTSAEQM